MAFVLTSVFRSLPVAYDTHRVDALPQDAVGYARDTVTLGWEDRLKIRARRVTDAGIEFATALPRATVLREGDCFLLNALRLVVRLVERAEPVFVIRPSTAWESALFAYHIGNSHQPIMLVDQEIVCPDILGVAQVLDYHGIPFARAARAFTPVGQVPSHRHPVSE